MADKTKIGISLIAPGSPKRPLSPMSTSLAARTRYGPPTTDRPTPSMNLERSGAKKMAIRKHTLRCDITTTACLSQAGIADPGLGCWSLFFGCALLSMFFVADVTFELIREWSQCP
ncbi:UNVERIFIED_CONTAM: hypothetical protein FKN15_065448 [Acipenser sinensis]